MHKEPGLDQRVRLAAVGDVMLGDSAICTGFGFASRYGGRPGVDALSNLSVMFGDADMVFGNLECTLSDRGHSARSWRSTQLRGHPAYAGALHSAGFRVMNVANNHASQHGHDAFADTVSLLREAGIECCGIRGIDGWATLPARVTVNGIRLGFLGYCLRPRQYSPETPPYAEGNPESILQDIVRLRDEVDHVVTSLHWGEEYVSQPATAEVELAHRVIDAGCTLLLGHHPHVHRPVERHGKGLVAYSLGNFVSDMIWYTPLRRPSVLTVDLSERVTNVEAERLWISDSFLPVRHDPPDLVLVDDEVEGLDEDAYRAEIARTIRESRIASYLYAAKRLHRFRTPTLFQLLAVTARNKLNSLMARTIRSS